MAQLNVHIINATNIHNKANEIGNPRVVVNFRGVEQQTSVKSNTANPKWNEKLTFNIDQAVREDDIIQISIFNGENERALLIRQTAFSLQDVVASSKPATFKVEMKDSFGTDTDSILNLTVSSTADPKSTISSKDSKKKQFPTALLRKELSTKKEDFQVRISIIKARTLVGIKLNPVARVDCCHQFRQTQVVSNSNSPFWNETFFFNLYTSAAELAKEIVNFSVFDSKTLRANALIGTFKYDLGNVLKTSNITNKWLLLTDFKDKSASCKGYLQVSVWVLSASDSSAEVKLMPTIDKEADDIESNLLRPAGLDLIPATFQLRLYRAEDFPYLTGGVIKGISSVVFNSSSKEACSPCVVFTFAGNKVHSSIKYKNVQPEWNEELHLNLHWPSMCSTICLRILHGTKSNEDEPIGTVFLDLDKISVEGVDPSLLSGKKIGESGGDEALKQQGFLPTFGPCFVNVYGAPRESSLSADNFRLLNRGQDDGVAYRGRLLVELAMNVGDMSTDVTSGISKETLNRAMTLLRRRKFRLIASFINASMLRIKNRPVYFEVSIGNYGNALDATVPPSSSTTVPTNPVFDGSHYFFLPWIGEKPCVVVETQWEDISYRLFTVNLINKIIDRIESNLDKIEIAVKAKLSDQQQAEFVIASFDELILQCSRHKKLPQQSKKETLETELDIRLRNMREAYFSCIHQDAVHMRSTITSIQDGFTRLQEYRDSLKAVAYEAQNSIPDVIIWMLSGEQRIAYHRIPAVDVIYSDNYDYRGRFCGLEQTIFLKPLTVSSDEDPGLLPGLLRVKIWFGLNHHVHVWQRANPEGEISIRAETYENQMNVLGKWVVTGGVARPAWSDASGRISLPRDDLRIPEGWLWEGEWFCAPECSLYYNFDAECTEVLEEVFYHESRESTSSQWKQSHIPYTDVEGVPVTPPGDRICPPGWKWSTPWQIEYNRACDEDGWEYSVHASVGGFIPIAKNYHMARRRRFVRVRIPEDSEGRSQLTRTTPIPSYPEECWEYASVFGPNVKFHTKSTTMDMVRRRRWHRKMSAVNDDAPSFIKLDGHSGGKQDFAAPRMFLLPYESHKWQLRAHIYQARDLPACSQDGMSDPYARVVFINSSASTKKMSKSLSPMWDQTLILDNVIIQSNSTQSLENPPHVVIEIFGFELLMEDNFLGRCAVSPMVKTDPDDCRLPILQWFKLKRDGCPAGELLAAFEMILVDEKPAPFVPPRKGDIFTVPSGVRPFLSRTAIEILCWGVRNLKKFQMAMVDNPEVEFEVASYSFRSDILNNAENNPNFANPWIFLDVMLPKEELYLPPMNIRIRDHRKFGRTPVIGVHIIKDLDKFRVSPRTAVNHRTYILAALEDYKAEIDSISTQTRQRPSELAEVHKRMYQSKVTSVDLKQLDADSDWWSKYYASTGENERCSKYRNQYCDVLRIYKTELEKVAGFNEFNDFLTTFKLTRGRNLEEGENLEEVGELKGVVKVYELPNDRSIPMPVPLLKDGLPESKAEECIIRVYVLQAFNLQPTDHEGHTDPYVTVTIGRKEMDCRDDYITNSLNPVFGRMFEIKCVIPMDKELCVCVKDRDLVLTDEVIGETKIDLENRLLTRFRATVGLPQSYCVSGPNVWRDSQSPMEILTGLCEKYSLGRPEITKNETYKDKMSLQIGSFTFTLTDFEQNLTPSAHWGAGEQRLALHILRLLPLVKEHVEFRALYNPLQPGIEQGKIQMFVDIFPIRLGTPGPPVDVRPREPKLYYLRAVIFNTLGVRIKKSLRLRRRNKQNQKEREHIVDLYVKGWIAGIDETQKTDVHYRAINGEGNFNWRFVFPFHYLPAENVMVVKRKANFWSIDLTETKMPAQLVIQIWDNDNFGPDDSLGTLELPLTSMPFPVKDSAKCDLNQIPENTKSQDPDSTFDIFESRRTNGFWPLYLNESGDFKMVGKVEMELELVTEEEAKNRPSGLGREEPNMNPVLKTPNRPDTSFRWFTSPAKTFRFIIWRRHKKAIISTFFLSILTTMLAVFFYAIPDTAARKLLGGG